MCRKIQVCWRPKVRSISNSTEDNNYVKVRGVGVSVKSVGRGANPNETLTGTDGQTDRRTDGQKALTEKDFEKMGDYKVLCL